MSEKEKILVSNSTGSSQASPNKKAQSKESKSFSKIDLLDEEERSYGMHNQFEQLPQRFTTIQPQKLKIEQELYQNIKALRQTVIPSNTFRINSQLENISLNTQKKTKPNEEVQQQINQENDSQYNDAYKLEGNFVRENFQSE